MNVEEFKFLENYYELLKQKKSINIGDRYVEQLSQLHKNGEIEKNVFNIAISCITIGKYIEQLNEENLRMVKTFINIGLEMKDEIDSQKLIGELNKNATKAIPKSSYEPLRRGGC